MNTDTYFNRATQTPGGGASNAADFQPPTQNPQSSQTNLQPNTLPQSAGGQDILNSQNAQISVPVSSGEPSFSVVEPSAPGMNWPLVVIVVVAAVLVARFLLVRWGRPRISRDYEPEATADNSSSTHSAPDDSQPELVAPPNKGKADSKATARSQKKPRKSKSKRKRR